MKYLLLTFLYRFICKLQTTSNSQSIWSSFIWKVVRYNFNFINILYERLL